jgi:DNA-directed RNA polymerase specialized sigma24 family protein
MVQSITDRSTSEDDVHSAATQEMQQSLVDATVFDLPQIMAAGIKAMEKTPPLSTAQKLIIETYAKSLPQPEQACFWLFRRKGMRPRAIAQHLETDLKWVQRTIARHMVELRMRLYPEAATAPPPPTAPQMPESVPAP